MGKIFTYRCPIHGAILKPLDKSSNYKELKMIEESCRKSAYLFFRFYPVILSKNYFKLSSFQEDCCFDVGGLGKHIDNFYRLDTVIGESS